MDAIKEFITNLLSDFDPAALLPELDTFLGKVELVARIAVLAGPAVLLFLGLCYLIFPAKEANHVAGYRFFWGMSSVEAWRFTQKTAGIVWSLLGLIMGGIVYLYSAKFHGMELMDAVWLAVKCIFWELGFVAASCLVIDITVFASYNSRGVARREPKAKKQKAVQEFYEEPEEQPESFFDPDTFAAAYNDPVQPVEAPVEYSEEELTLPPEYAAQPEAPAAPAPEAQEAPADPAPEAQEGEPIPEALPMEAPDEEPEQTPWE